MANYFRSLMTTAPLTVACVYGAADFLAVRWLRRQLSGQELLEMRSVRILNGERGPQVRGSVMNGRHAPAARWICCFPKSSLPAISAAVWIR
jgi:hypothetical protein